MPAPNVTVGNVGNADDGYPVFVNGERVGSVASNRQWGGTCWSFFAGDRDDPVYAALAEECDYDNKRDAFKRVKADVAEALTQEGKQ